MSEKNNKKTRQLHGESKEFTSAEQVRAASGNQIERSIRIDFLKNDVIGFYGLPKNPIEGMIAMCDACKYLATWYFQQSMPKKPESKIIPATMADIKKLN